MTRMLLKTLSRFRREEDGSASVEFVLYFTVLFMILSASVEIAYINLRHAMLERSVDLVTRDIRLNTGDVPTYEQIKQDICTQATIVDACEDNMRLEMVQIDPRNPVMLDPEADCQNASQEARPVRNFVAGTDNDIMLIRACMKYRTLMPTTRFGAQLNYDDEGYAQLIVTSAFVQEPR
ncbi:TadE/TadG family type IV pilus assembly protein [Cognatishimia sp. F0-27]|uniref:TadE/TadG family type IV pilus assembly protein n=1 Tax=Cognatishimia sp. F0-27 TaxID=2816855 RepID=UPI001D0C00A8|nr:pilus assembly protein [Cognatishimia sp. F0-27]MCC1491721.1 pilus assembly protein [Cognatishimia sp. F0-27]